MRPRPLLRTAALLACAALLAAPMFGAGFGIFEQGTKAMGMAGAFTAQADDPSAMFHNVGGLAFFDERQIAGGFTLITSSEGNFRGAAPFPGPETEERLDSLFELPPHAYWVEPINDRLVFGLALNAPFGLITSWGDDFSGRFISKKGELTAIDITPNLGYQVSDNFGIGVGLIVRFSEVTLLRNLPVFNPFKAQIDDAAAVTLASDFDNGIGFQLGFLHKVNERLSWGASYRSNVEVDFGGDATFTQIPTGSDELDALVRASGLPFGRDLGITTSLEFPDSASLGVAYRFTPAWLAEVDVNYTGWSSVDRIEIRFDGGVLPSEVLSQNWEDVNNYRLGVRWQRRPRSEWRFGVVYDESPQPDENVGPLLPDADRIGFTAGYGRQLKRFNLDLAIMSLNFRERTVLVNEDDYNGTWNATAWLFGATVSW